MASGAYHLVLRDLCAGRARARRAALRCRLSRAVQLLLPAGGRAASACPARAADAPLAGAGAGLPRGRDRKSTRLNSSHGYISYAVFCLKKKKKKYTIIKYR